jgi:hypothetical protein
VVSCSALSYDSDKLGIDFELYSKAFEISKLLHVVVILYSITGYNTGFNDWCLRVQYQGQRRMFVLVSCIQF